MLEALISVNILYTSHFCPDKSGRQVSLCSVFQTLELYLNLIEALCHGPKHREQVDSHDRVGGNSYSCF